MALTCPQCAAPMNEVKAEASMGYFILLDQYPRCGGIWCDRWELYPVTAAAADRLDAVDQQALWQPVGPAADQLQCPRCRAHMKTLRDPTIPADARIERCPNCEGMWLNRGELHRLKRRGAPIAPAAAALSAPEIDRLAVQAGGDPKLWPTVANLSAAFDAAPQPPPAEDITHELMTGAAWVIARAALRLLLHI